MITLVNERGEPVVVFNDNGVQEFFDEAQKEAHDNAVKTQIQNDVHKME